MNKNSLPSIFISHGVPTLPLDSIPAREFLKELGSIYQNIKAILCISAHWQTSIPTVNSLEKPGTIHDFYGFPEELYKIEYPAKGNPELAEYVSDLIQDKGIYCDINHERGLDHGTWVPMMLMFPHANVPVVQLSIQNHLDPIQHLKVGRAIEELRNNKILIIGSGGAVHPLGYSGFRFGSKTDQWALEFDDWLTDAVIHGDERLLINYRNFAPYPERAHPYPDHYMPLITAYGAAGNGAKGKVIHHSWYAGDLGMAAYQFQDSSIIN
jgi:4,5-DOPA dioxygenase extradiol